MKRENKNAFQDRNNILIMKDLLACSQAEAPSGKERYTSGVRGQGLVEYLILVCLVAVSAIAVVSVVGKNVREQYANISAALRNGKKVETTSPAPDAYEIRGMDDFWESARTDK